MNKGIEYIKKGEIEMAIKWLEGLLSTYSRITKDPETKEELNRLYAVSARFKKLKTEVLQGIIRKEDEEISHNKIVIALIDKIGNIPEWLVRSKFEICSAFVETLTKPSSDKNLKILQRITEYFEYLMIEYPTLRSKRVNWKEEFKSRKDISIGIIGDVGTGKSSLINKIIGRTIIPPTVLHTRYGLITIEWGEEEYVELEKNLFQIERHSINSIPNLLSRLEKENENKTKVDLHIIRIYLNENILKGKKIIEFCPHCNYSKNWKEQIGYIELQKKLLFECSVLIEVQNAMMVGGKSRLNEINRLKDFFGENIWIVVNFIDHLIHREKNYYNDVYEHAKKIFGKSFFFVSCFGEEVEGDETDCLKESIQERSEELQKSGYNILLQNLLLSIENIIDEFKLKLKLIPEDKNDFTYRLLYSLHYIESLHSKINESYEILKTQQEFI